jgi:D-alanine-D-alanine ligase
VRLLQLVGSPVDDVHADLSRLYAAGCVDALSPTHDMALAYVSPGGAWRFPTSLRPADIADAPAMALAEAVEHVMRQGIDVVVPQMFCLPGMTSYRALFDVIGIPYVGNTPTVMGNAADKAKTRAIVAAAGVAVPSGEVVRAGERPTLAPPVVVKPVASDNSVGVTLVRDPRDYPSALKHALAQGDSALVESYVALGREVRCGVVVRDGELLCLPLEEYAVDPLTKPIRDEGDKLARTDGGELYLVAKNTTHAWIVPTDDPITQRVWAAARRCHVALGCRHYSLFDFRIDEHGQPWFLEAGPYCSYAPTSVISVMAAAAGMSVTDLFALALHELEVQEASWLTSPR